MTQQNEIEQGTAEPEQSPRSAAAQPEYPSPYLDGTQAVPQAYLAPPQPGQPRYGELPLSRGRRPFGVPGNAPPVSRQPASGQPATTRPGPRAAAPPGRRDPALALPWERLVASTVDWIIIFGVWVIAFWSPLSRFWRAVRAFQSRYPDPLSPAAQAAYNSLFKNSAIEHATLYSTLGLFGIALVYFWVQHAAWGTTLGKRSLGIRVVRSSDQSRIGVLAAGLRAVVFLAGPSIFVLLGGLSPFNYAGGVLWAADAGLPLLDLQAQSLHDKLAGTIVIRKRPVS